MIYSFDLYLLDSSNKKLWRNDTRKDIKLRPKCFHVLQLLVERYGNLVPYADFISIVWEQSPPNDSQGAVSTCIKIIRKALNDDDQRFIRTERPYGYSFIAPVSMVDPPKSVPIANPQYLIPDAFSSRAPLSSRDFGPLVEREAALDYLYACLEKAQRGERQVVFVIGEAGSGKTALVDAFLGQVAADDGLWVAQGQCDERHGPGEPYMPVLEALDRLCLTSRGGSLVTLLRQQAPTWLGQIPRILSIDEREQLRRELLGEIQQPRMLREMAEVVETLTAETPLVLVLEDLHWIDPSTLDLVMVLARRPEPARLLLLGTYRPEEVVHGHSLRAAKQTLQMHRQCEELPLKLLSEAGIATYLTERFAINAFPAQLAQVIHQRTSGNPFFVVKVLEHLEENGLLGEHNGQWGLRGELTAVESSVPEHLRELIDQQFNRLDKLEQSVLAAASAIGVEFSAAVVAAALEIDVVEVEERCDKLARRKHLLQPAGTTTQPEEPESARYAFKHWLCQDVIYQLLGATRRPRLHQRIGYYLKEVYGDRARERAVELALNILTRGKTLRWPYSIINKRPRTPSSGMPLRRRFSISRKG